MKIYKYIVTQIKEINFEVEAETNEEAELKAREKFEDIELGIETDFGKRTLETTFETSAIIEDEE